MVWFISRLLLKANTASQEVSDGLNADVSVYVQQE